MKKDFKILARSCCLAVMFSLVSNNITALARMRYYYQGTQMSAINHPTRQDSFLLVGGERMVALPTDASSNSLLQPLSQIDRSIVPAYFLGDGKSQDMQIDQDSLFALKSLKDQSSYQTTDYRAYGGKAAKQNINAMADFGYNGEYQDPNTQLVYLRARDYDAGTQRFIAMDSYPLLNRYASFGSDPINHIDPSGHDAKQWFKDNAAWLVPTVLIVGGGFAFGVYKYRSNRSLPSLETGITKAGIIYHGKFIGSGKFGKAYLMESGDYEGKVFKLVHNGLERDSFASPERNVRYLNKANGESDFAQLVTLKSGEKSR